MPLIPKWTWGSESPNIIPQMYQIHFPEMSQGCHKIYWLRHCRRPHVHHGTSGNRCLVAPCICFFTYSTVSCVGSKIWNCCHVKRTYLKTNLNTTDNSVHFFYKTCFFCGNMCFEGSFSLQIDAWGVPGRPQGSLGWPKEIRCVPKTTFLMSFECQKGEFWPLFWYIFDSFFDDMFSLKKSVIFENWCFMTVRARFLKVRCGFGGSRKWPKWTKSEILLLKIWVLEYK